MIPNDPAPGEWRLPSFGPDRIDFQFTTAGQVEWSGLVFQVEVWVGPFHREFSGELAFSSLEAFADALESVHQSLSGEARLYLWHPEEHSTALDLTVAASSLGHVVVQGIAVCEVLQAKSTLEFRIDSDQTGLLASASGIRAALEVGARSWPRCS